ncbi:MAG: IS21 family transposase [Undibacterium umbellatum]|uniref:IS21 family transposase n=1 Tax=Undibacterium umbellatum TaxID=2762300 RepID=UPI003BB6482E
MRKIRDVLTCLYKNNLSERKTSQLTGISRPTVSEYRTRFKQSKLAWPLPDHVDDDILEALLFPSTAINKRKPEFELDYGVVDLEMKKKGATLQGIYNEITENFSDAPPLSYSQFTRNYSRFKKSLRISLRRTFQFGEVGFVDYAGHTISINDIATGKVKDAQIFVGVLGASLYTYAEATWTQKMHDWTESHVRMFQFFCGVPSEIVPDNLKSGVSKADLFMPMINETYMNLCRHYSTSPVPARAFKPKDKSRAEAAVLLVERWILFRLRKRKFFNLEDANKFIHQLLSKLNNKPFQKLEGSRHSRWDQYEKDALQPLPIERYEFSEWGKVRAGADYHATVDHHSYSVPYQYRNLKMEYKLTSTTIQFSIGRKTIASHLRSYVKGGVTTVPDHRPPNHGAYAGWSAEESQNWAQEIGPGAAEFFSIQLKKISGITLGYRFFNSMKKLEKEFGRSRLEEICVYAIKNNILDTARIRDMLNRKIDLSYFNSEGNAADNRSDAFRKSIHANIRGPEYYKKILGETKGGKE